MNRFIQTLRESGYRQFYLAFGDANLRQKDWFLAAKTLRGPLLDLVKLFLLQQPVPRAHAMALLGEDSLGDLLKCGILLQKSGQIISDAFLLIYCRGHAMFCQMKPDTFAYFGDDSLALATYQTPAPGGRVLDLCCGPGIQSYVAATYAAKVTGVEIRKETWRIAQLNRRLNDAQRVEFICASAEDFARTTSEKFDRILFNPPLVPMVPGYKFAFAGNGGADGLDVTRRIVSLYHGKLSAGGAIEFVGIELGRSDRSMECAEIKAIARRHGLGGRVQLLSQHPMKPFAPLFEALALSFARDNRLEIDEGRKILANHFAKLKARDWWLFFASLHRASSTADKNVSIVDVSKSFWGNWFV
ncbi:MAG TPA: methyltransferase domain-containing protein [Verrucomicrobiae bacterium]|nr:methyltransferase domain-containing protein [Verrucomicrobiae bacterium]